MKKLLIATVAAVLTISAVAFGQDGARTKTIDDLEAAFTGETTASAKYAAYAKKAAEEGFNKVSKLFEAASKSESIHAANHKAVMEQLGVTVPKVDPKFEVKSTVENLQDAIKGESY